MTGFVAKCYSEHLKRVISPQNGKPKYLGCIDPLQLGQLFIYLDNIFILSKLFISCLLHHRKTLAVLRTNRQLWPRIVWVYHHVRMPGPRKENNERGGQGLIQDPKDGSLLQMPPGPQSTEIHVARSGNFNLWWGWSTWHQLAELSHLRNYLGRTLLQVPSEFPLSETFMKGTFSARLLWDF